MAATTSIVFVCVAGGGMLGLLLRRVVPADHLSAESRDVVKLGMGLVGTMTALLLGMQLGSAKDAYDRADAEMKEIAGKVGYLDRVLAIYGPETREARAAFVGLVARGVDEIWASKAARTSLPNPAESGGESLYVQLQQLTPDTPLKASLKAEAMALATEIARLRWLLFAQASGRGSVVFLVVIVAWLTVVFTSFGLLGVPNATVIVTLIVCAMAVSSAIGLIMELNHPFSGLIQLPSDPLRNALGFIGR